MRILKNNLLSSMNVHHTYECFYELSTENIVAVRCADLMDLEDIYSTGIDIVIGNIVKPQIKSISHKSIITDPSNYIEIPGSYYIYVKSLMLNHFCESIEDTKVSDSLLFTLKHRNKSNADRFMQTLKVLNLENRLIAFKENFYLSIAMDWCRTNNIEMIK